MRRQIGFSDTPTVIGSPKMQIEAFKFFKLLAPTKEEVECITGRVTGLERSDSAAELKCNYFGRLNVCIFKIQFLLPRSAKRETFVFQPEDIFFFSI